MYFGDEKTRQMVRSLLPSTMRKAARQMKKVAKKRAKIVNRRLVKKMLINQDEYEETLFEDSRNDIRYVVRNRRDADKVGPFVSWVVKKTKDIPQENRKSFVRGLVPPNTIGDHALTHLPYLGFDHPNEEILKQLQAESWKGRVQKNNPNPYQELVRKTIERGLHSELNRSMKHFPNHVPDGFYPGYYQFPRFKVIGPTRPRKLLGLHDVTNFVTDVLNAQYGDPKLGLRHPEWLQSLDAFLIKNRQMLY